MLRALLLLLAALGASQTADGFRALGLFPFPGHSHFIFVKALFEALAERGHQVTMLSPFPQKTALANYTDVDLSYLLPTLSNSLSFEQMASPSTGTVHGMMKPLDRLAGNSLCRTVFRSKEFKGLMSGAYGEFDLVITELFGSDCWVAVAHVMKLPLISVTSTPDLPWMHERMGSIDNPSYLPSVYQDFVGRMNFWQRTQNVYSWLVSTYLHKALMVDGSDEVVREFLGADVPPLSQLVRNTSLVLVNRHASVHAARPVPPNVVHVGGLHLRAGPRSDPRAAAAALDAELRAWMDSAERGVVFFSLGSMVPSSTLPRDAQRALLAAFATLPQRVLWKFEAELPGLPDNVRVAKWMPQAAILGHPKTVLFITHGGLMGTTEALFSGVPMLGIPLFADQGLNIAQYKELGIAERLDHWALDEKSVRDMVKRMTSDDRYLRRAREVSALYRDRPLSTEEEAVWWVEYVVRHRGAPHLRPLGADLPWYQYLLLDVVAAALAVVLLLLACAYTCIAKLAGRRKAKRD